jgi:FkbM family methyltransferase
MVSVAIIDVIGLTYDGDTLKTRGLGGSESAVILISKELSKLGFAVTVINNCIDSKSSPGIYDGVTYVDHTQISDDMIFDVVISSRTIIPFLPENLQEQFSYYSPTRYDNIKKTTKHKILWMHDTFCKGDEYLEFLTTTGHINEIFTLSDFHTSYTTTCSHGQKRMFEVLKDKIFMTRNGVVKYFDEIDMKQKDPNLFVYNASVTKGMLPLVNDIWAKVKQQIPEAKLKVIGGYYRFRENAAPDEQENTWREMVENPVYSQMDIEFTGIITQREIAEILSKASFTIFPGAFPETFGISSLESLTYNTPLITTRFGALEETAVNNCSYLIDYAIEPNGLYPHINKQFQVNKFVDMTVRAHTDRYLHQQKMYYCNIVKDICTWDTVALQWKQHLFKKLGLYLSAIEYRKVSKINSRVHQVFGRRFSNPEENYIPRSKEQRIVVITPVYNAREYIERCIASVVSQDYVNFNMYIIDDCSTDDTYDVAKSFIEKIKEPRITIIKNKSNMGAVYNQISTILEFCAPDDIVMLLDGDDSLVNDNQIFHYYNNLYDGTTEFTYGSCWSMIDNIPLIAQNYPEEVKKNKTYREHKFNWNMPYTHLRTFKAYLLDSVSDDAFKDENGNWYKAGGDGSVFYALIENADPNKVKAVQDIVYNYNDKNPLNDYKVNATEQTKTANSILNKAKNKVKKILIAYPTAKNIEPKSFKSVYDLQIPEGYTTELQYFYGYQVDQVRNLIAEWSKNYDYLFAVDSDIAFKPDTLKKLLSHDKDIVSGLYIQRKPGKQILEIYKNGRNVPYSELKNKGLVEIDSCGFGCVLIKSDVIRSMEYPHFLYKSAIDHKNTLSEDTYFCIKAREKGFKVYADTSILCEHIGQTSFVIEEQESTFDKLLDLSNRRLLPIPHVSYLQKLKEEGTSPKVVYDIGACVLHWTREAVNIWEDAKYIAFEAMDECKLLYDHFAIEHNMGLLSSQDGKTIEFYQDIDNPGGNSYYKETTGKFTDEHKIVKTSRTLDSVVKERNFPKPDMIKMDVQGAELDIIKGAKETLKHCKNLILELQKVEYNKGAPLKNDVIDYLQSIGFELVSKEPFSNNGVDGDYHFRKK